METAKDIRSETERDGNKRGTIRTAQGVEKKAKVINNRSWTCGSAVGCSAAAVGRPSPVESENNLKGM